MTAIGTTRADTPQPTTLPRGAYPDGAPSTRTADTPATGPSLIDRFLAPAGTAAQPMHLTPVQQGEAARASDDAMAAGDTKGAVTGGLVGGAVGGPIGAIIGTVIGGARQPDHPISVESTTTKRADGTTLTINTMDVAANFRLDGGTLHSGETATGRARTIEQTIERDFTKTYREANGDETRYVTDVHMTVNGPADSGREQLVLVDQHDARLQGGVGIAPAFETGRVAYISDHAPGRTAPHEFGHLAGLRHTAQYDLGCKTAPGIDIDNLMSQTSCSKTSEQIERSQLQQIFNTPHFR